MRPQPLVFLSSLRWMLLAIVALAQTPASMRAQIIAPPIQPPVVTPPAPTVVRWQNGAPNSDWRVWNGKTTLILRQGGFTVSLRLDCIFFPWTANLSIANDTDHRVEFVPSQITLDLVEPHRVSFPHLDPDKLAASTRSRSRWADVFAAMGAGMATQESRTRGTVTADDGSTATIEATTTTPDRATQTQVATDVERNRQDRAAEASPLTRRALRENTLIPGQFIIGAVYFGPPNHSLMKAYNKWVKAEAIEYDLRVPLGDYIFEFPYSWPARK